jgi:hypothetical protein
MYNTIYNPSSFLLLIISCHFHIHIHKHIYTFALHSSTVCDDDSEFPSTHKHNPSITVSTVLHWFTFCSVLQVTSFWKKISVFIKKKNKNSSSNKPYFYIHFLHFPSLLPTNILLEYHHHQLSCTVHCLQQKYMLDYPTNQSRYHVIIYLFIHDK